MSQDYNPSLVTKSLVFCGDAAMKSAAGPATLLYDKVNDNNGTMYNGTCFDFDGTDDLVLTSDPIVTGTGDFTYTAWINRATVNGTDYICGNYGTGNYGIEFYGASNGGVRCYHRGSNVISATTLVADTWYHVAVTRSSGTGQIYINGAVDGASVSIAGSIGAVLNFAIGNGPNYTSENFDGIIADVKVFDIALSAANMKELYDDSKVIIPSNVSQTNLKGWWTLAEGAGDICYDGSGNGYDGTASGEDGDEWLTGQTGAPQLVEGYNRPMLFDGSSNYVQVASDGSSTFANQSFTVAGWIYTSDASPSGDRVLFSYDYTSHVNPYYSIHVRLNGSTPGRLYFIWNNGTTAYDITKDSAFTDNTWHHYACTFTSGSQKIYIDGAEVASGTRADTITYYNQEVWIGKGNFGGYWDGLINETVVYNSVLSLAQVQVLAAHAPVALSGELTSGWTNRDFSSFSSSGTNITNMVSSGTGQNAYAVLSTPCVVGNKYKISFAASKAAPDGLYFTVSKSVEQSPPRVNIKTVGWAAGSQSYEFTATDTWTHIGFERAYGTLGTEPQIWDWSFVQLGGPLPPNPMSLSNSSNVVGYWRNDGDVTWTDRSGNGNTGTVNGSPDTLLFKQGINGSASTSAGRDNQGFPLKQKNVGAVGFNGSSDYIDLGSDPSETGRVFSSGAFTVSAWVKSANTVPGGGYSNVQNIVGFPANNVGHLAIIHTTGKLAYWDYGTGAWIYGNTALASNEWYHVVLVFDGDDGAFFYVNGEADSAELSWGGTAVQKKCTVRYIGAQDPSRYFNGQIANTQIYNRALTQTEIKQNFAAQANRFQVPRGIVGSGLRMWLDAAQPGSYPGSGTTWYDLSGNDNNVTLQNGTTFSTTKGGVIVFNGAKDGTLDVSSWIKDVSYVTMSGWWYHNADASGAPFSILTDTSPISSSDGFWWHDSYSGGATLYLRTEDASAGEKGTSVPAGVYVSAGNWYHVAVVVGKSTFDLYYNGVLYYSWATGGFDWANLNSDAAILHLALQHGGYANGSMGNVQLYDRALSASQVAQNFRAGSERFGVTMGA